MERRIELTKVSLLKEVKDHSRVKAKSRYNYESERDLKRKSRLKNRITSVRFRSYFGRSKIHTKVWRGRKYSFNYDLYTYIFLLYFLFIVENASRKSKIIPILNILSRYP